MNMDKLNLMEYLLRENIMLRIENSELKSLLNHKEIISDEELELSYKNYYTESNEVRI